MFTLTKQPQDVDMAGQAGDDAPASQDAERDLGPDGFLDYDPRPYERTLRERYAGWHIRDDALEQIERFLNSDYAGVDLKSDFAPLKDRSCVKD
jgi:hypothetical protein